MRSRRHAKLCVSAEERKLPVCFSLSAWELEKVDRAARKRGFKNRTEFIMSVLRSVLIFIFYHYSFVMGRHKSVLVSSLAY